MDTPIGTALTFFAVAAGLMLLLALAAYLARTVLVGASPREIYYDNSRPVVLINTTEADKMAGRELVKELASKAETITVETRALAE